MKVALSRIAANDDTRAYVSYDHTGLLVRLTGNTYSVPPADGNSPSYDQLRGTGAYNLTPYGIVLDQQVGIELLDAAYTVSAGTGARRSVGVVAGGQDPQRVTSGLTGQGWTPATGGLLEAPRTTRSEDAGNLTIALARVRVDGADVVFGVGQTTLAEVGKPAGPTLADDPRTAALADCLGDVAAAIIDTPATDGALQPTAIAVGVRTPRKADETPHAVVCASWADKQTAGTYQASVTQALAEGSTNDRIPWSDKYSHVKVRNLGGKQNVVAWEGDAAHPNAVRILDMSLRRDYPALLRTEDIRRT